MSSYTSIPEVVLLQFTRLVPVLVSHPAALFSICEWVVVSKVRGLVFRLKVGFNRVAPLQLLRSLHAAFNVALDVFDLHFQQG